MPLRRWADARLRAANDELRQANAELHDANAELMQVQCDLASEQDRIRQACESIGVSQPPRIPLPPSHLRRKRPKEVLARKS